MKGKNIPDVAFFIKVGFELLIDRSLNIEEDESGSEVEEEGSHGGILTWADPVRESHMGYFSTAGEGIGEPWSENYHLLPNPNTTPSGSLTERSSFPSFRYRSGLNMWGLG